LGIDKIGTAETARRAALQAGQDSATALIYAEAKLGELLKGIPNRYDLGSPGKTKTLPSGINKRLSHQAQTISANMPIGAEVPPGSITNAGDSQLVISSWLFVVLSFNFLKIFPFQKGFYEQSRVDS
jgi:hypothetical protein